MKINQLVMIMFALLLSASMFAQYVQLDFEPGGLGADWGWTVGENGDNPPVEFVSNPATGGINTSATAAQFIARAAGQPWALCFTDDIGDFTFDADNSTITIMVNKPVISNVAIKFEGAGAPAEIAIANTLTNEWEEISYDFSGFIGSAFNRLIVIPDFEARTEDHIIYFDNIQLPEGSNNPVPEPDFAAPTPLYPEDNVISLFSNAYTNVPVDTWSADWDQADVADVQIEGNDTKLYTNLVFAGIEFTSQTIDATAMTNFYMDVWTPDPTALPAIFKIKLVDFGADGVWGGGDDVEFELTFDETTTPALISENWIAFDIPLSDFTGLTTTGHLAQLIISGDPNTVYVDNVLFYDGTNGFDLNTTILNPVTLGDNYPNPFNPVTTINYSISQSAYITLNVFDMRGRLVENLVNSYKPANNYTQVWNAEKAASGIYFYSLEVDGKTIDTKRMVLLK